MTRRELDAGAAGVRLYSSWICRQVSCLPAPETAALCNARPSRSYRNLSLPGEFLQFAMLADEILATIMERPGISAPEIRAAFPAINRNSVASAIGRLREDGRIENAGRGGTYRSAEAKAPDHRAAAGRTWRQGSIAPAPLARLMAGR